MILWILGALLAGVALILVGVSLFMVSSQVGVTDETESQAISYEQTLYGLWGGAGVVGGAAAIVLGLGSALNKRAQIDASRR